MFQWANNYKAFPSVRLLSLGNGDSFPEWQKMLLICSAWCICRECCISDHGLESAVVVPQSVCTVGIKRIGDIVVSAGIFPNSAAAC